MVTSATKDAFQFSVDEARKSVARAEAIARLFGTSTKHTIIESPHDYNQEMREAMYGWMAKHLKGEGMVHPFRNHPCNLSPARCCCVTPMNRGRTTI